MDVWCSCNMSKNGAYLCVYPYTLVTQRQPCELASRAEDIVFGLCKRDVVSSR